MSKIINVRLVTNAGSRSKSVMDSVILRQFYEENGVNYGSTTNTINSIPLQHGDLEKPLSAFTGGADQLRISSIVKQDNAAKIYLNGAAAVVKSSVKLEDWKKVLAYDPEFGIYDEDGEEMIFAAFIDKEGAGSLTKNGIIWSEIPDQQGFATATILMSPTTEDREEAIRNTIGRYIPNLNTLEANIPGVLEDAEKYDKEISDSIVVM